MSDFRLPDDASLAWVRESPAAQFPRERRAIGTILAHDDDGLMPQALGNVFVIHAAGDVALCLCAAHSVEAIRSLDRSQRRRFEHIPPNVGEMAETEYLRVDRLLVVFQSEDGRGAVECRVVDMAFQGDNDVALIVVRGGSGFFDSQLAISLDVPSVGDVVTMVGSRIDLSVPSDSDSRSKQLLGREIYNISLLSQALEYRTGVVSRVSLERTGSGQSFVIHATFPTLGGMSGSPVFLDLRHGGPMAAIGIISADFSEDGAEGDTRLAGDTAISVLWPAAALSMDMQWDGVTKLTTLAEVLERGAIHNLTKRSILETVTSKSAARLRFHDPAHGAFEHLTPGHPNAPDSEVRSLVRPGTP